MSAPQAVGLVVPKPSPPRPRPEHVVALADDLRTAAGLLAGTPADQAVGAAMVTLVENSLRNFAAAMGAR